MAHDVFISYSSKNKATADAICHSLEENGIKCWIAPRDIVSGVEYGDIIPEAIKESKICLVIFSEYANISRWVKSEIRIAFDNNCFILPFKIDRTQPSGQMEIYLKGEHWLDAYPNPTDHFQMLSEDIQLLLNNKSLNNRKKNKTKKWIYYIISSIIFFILLASLLFTKSKQKQNGVYLNDSISLNNEKFIPTSISYKLENPLFFDEGGSELYGYVEGQKYRIEIDEDIKCMNLFYEYDFDDDGLKDALIENISACGGNATPNTYFFVSYKGEGFFQISKEFGECWEEAKVEKWNNTMSVIIESANAGYNNKKELSVKERYIFKDGKLQLVESMKKNKIIASSQITSTEYNEKNFDDEKFIFFDLDEDGIKDKITCIYWERWGSLMIDEIEFSSGIKINPGMGCKRVGVLESKTNKVHDLVCGEDYILKWDGKEYK